MLLTYDLKRLRSDIRQTPTRRKYRNALLAVANLFAATHRPLTHGGNGEDSGKGRTCLYWDTGTCYADIEVNPSGQHYSLYIRRYAPGFPSKEWFFDDLVLADFQADWLVRFLAPFKREVEHG